MSDDGLDGGLSDVASVLGAVEALYKDVHRHPELSMQEERTAGLAAQHLRDAGVEVTTGVGHTGVVGVLENGDGPTVMLRADMDALPVQEQTGLDYSSTVDGVSTVAAAMTTGSMLRRCSRSARCRQGRRRT